MNIEFAKGFESCEDWKFWNYIVRLEMTCMVLRLLAPSMNNFSVTFSFEWVRNFAEGSIKT